MKIKTSDGGRSEKTTKPTSRPNRRIKIADIDLPFYGRAISPNRTDFHFLQEDMASVALGLKGRNEAVLFNQLHFAVLASAAKIGTRDPNDPDGETGKQKISQVLDNLCAAYPLLPKRRSLDGWCEGLIAGLIYLGLLPFQLPKNGEKMPRLTDLKQIADVTYGHIGKLDTEFHCMAKLRKFARSCENTAKPPIDLLDRVLCLLDSDKPLSDNQLRKLSHIIAAAQPHLAFTGADPISNGNS